MSPSLFYAVVLISISTTSLAGEERTIGLGEGSPTMKVENRDFHRGIPHMYFDQAMGSLPYTEPSFEILCKRRYGTAGNVIYSMICWKGSSNSSEVRVAGMAAKGVDNAWYYEVNVPERELASTLIRIIEAISLLPSTKSLEPSAKDSDG